MKPSGPAVFFMGRFLTTNSIISVDIMLFRLCYFLGELWKFVSFQDFEHCITSYQIYWHKVAFNICLLDFDVYKICSDGPFLFLIQ